MNLQEFVHNILKPHFTGFLKANLDYNDNNFEFLNYNILGSSDDEIDINVPDILLKDNDNLIAIVLFKRWESFEETEAFTRTYLKSIQFENCPTFWVYNTNEIFILQPYGWQKIELQNFPTFEQLSQTIGKKPIKL
jgi:hypothetical protein